MHAHIKIDGADRSRQSGVEETETVLGIIKWFTSSISVRVRWRGTAAMMECYYGSDVSVSGAVSAP